MINCVINDVDGAGALRNVFDELLAAVDVNNANISRALLPLND